MNHDTLDNNILVFFALLRAGLWEKDIRLQKYEPIDFQEVYRIATEQSVEGLIVAGLEHVTDMKIALDSLAPFMGMVLQLEQRNKEMNRFVRILFNRLQEAGVHAILVKGQGIAQCYERPLWRASGDIDLLLDRENYEKAKTLLSRLAITVEEEDPAVLHQGMTIDGWVVELHGTMHTALSKQMNNVIDEVQRDAVALGGVRIWDNEECDVYLPNADNDIILIFTHFIGHFYGSGIGLRQICDLYRLLYVYRESISAYRLKACLHKMGLEKEWNAFASFAIDYLGVQESLLPYYKTIRNHKRKAKQICNLIIQAGNFGHNKDESYRKMKTSSIKNMITFFRRLGEFTKIAFIFPHNAPAFFIHYVHSRISAL